VVRRYAHRARARSRTGARGIALFGGIALSLGLAGLGLAAGSPLGDSAAAWPASWSALTLAGGGAISDLEDESGISPPNLDISSNGGGASSVSVAADASNIFFRLRVKVDPTDAGKGGFDNAFWLVQIATGADETVRAIAGLNG
jgi:hypothetical protein